jgi:peptidoglycan/xylan/chitin deacetylase (PgdA/CDA1 family)
MALRPLFRRIRSELGEALGIHRRALAALGGSAAVVLTYHRVLPPERAAALEVEAGMTVSPATFRRHCGWLRDAMQVLPLGEVVRRLEAGLPLPEAACALSFDDGWRDNAEHAWPILREAGLPAAVFLVTGRVGTQGAFWPDEVCRRLAPLGREERRAAAQAARLPGDGRPQSVLAILKRLPEAERDAALDRLRAATPEPPAGERELLDWDEVQRMAAGGVAFESHGHEHRLLTRVAPDAARADLSRARAVLAERGLGGDALLAYPGGDHDARVRGVAAACGHRAAFTTGPGLARAGDPLHALARIGVHEDVSASRAELRRRLARAASGRHGAAPAASASRSDVLRAATSAPSR